MSTDPLTRLQLDKLTCAAPGCTHEKHGPLFLNARCHARKPTIVKYFGDGVVEIRCRICNSFVASIALDDRDKKEMSSKIECHDPTCKEPPENHKLVLKPPCHPTAGSVVTYHAVHLTIACGKCKRDLSTFHVKEGTDGTVSA